MARTSIKSDLKNMTESQFRTAYKKTKAQMRRQQLAAKKTT
jgi:hypothetical protein|tara:strand:+ start:530 stop:652 length:123 start_codon:yes stop_codon:yes gene_type:complete